MPVSAAREVALTSVGWSVFRVEAAGWEERRGLEGAVVAVALMLRAAARRRSGRSTHLIDGSSATPPPPTA